MVNIGPFMGTVFEFPYRTVVELSLSALLKNLAHLRLVSECEVIPVIKADAYGHGMIPVAKILLTRGSVQMLAVATLEEAIALRKQFHRPFQILVLSGFLPHQMEAYQRYNLTPMIHCLYHAKSLGQAGACPSIHLKFDSGMNRLGIRPDEMPEVIALLKERHIKLAGFASHFAESEQSSSSFANEQLALFEHWYNQLKSQELLNTDARIHIANSGGILQRKLGPSNAVRAGISLYGISPNPLLNIDAALVPVMQWKTRVLCFKKVRTGETIGYGRTYQAKRDLRLAILPVGYADGYPRIAGQRGEVLIGDRRFPIRGRISMDMMAVEVDESEEIKEGASVTLIGKSSGAELSVWEVAQWADTIPYEVVCGLSPRVTRIYFDTEGT